MAAPARQTMLAGERTRVLVIDDPAVIRRLVTRALAGDPEDRVPDVILPRCRDAGWMGFSTLIASPASSFSKEANILAMMLLEMKPGTWAVEIYAADLSIRLGAILDASLVRRNFGTAALHQAA